MKKEILLQESILFKNCTFDILEIFLFFCNKFQDNLFKRVY